MLKNSNGEKNTSNDSGIKSEDQFHISAPAISLPKGGGAMRGMGEKFAANPVTGTGSMSVPQYRDADESDVFLFSGAEDLVPIPDAPLVREIGEDRYQIKRYRPRVEGLFARIERWTRTRNGDVHWRSLSKDNILTLSRSQDL